MYTELPRRSKRKGLTLTFTRKEFYAKFGEDLVLKQLHQEWLASDMDYALTPTIDRINNLRGYELDNIQFLTLSDNSIKGQVEKAKMGFISGAKPVRLTKDAEVLEFPSAQQASKYLNMSKRAVSLAIKMGYRVSGYSPKYL
jgi:hypothetical protein